MVAGLRHHISREELTGRLVALVLNLRPAKLAGELSEAMMLAADHTAVSRHSSLMLPLMLELNQFVGKLLLRLSALTHLLAALLAALWP